MATAPAPQFTITGLQFTFEVGERLELKDQGTAQRLAEIVSVHRGGERVAVITSGPAKYPLQQRHSVLTVEGSVRHPSFTGVPIVVEGERFKMAINPQHGG